MKRKMIRKKLYWAAWFSVFFLLPIVSLSWHSDSIIAPYGDDNHELISKDSLWASNPVDYPDLWKFFDEIWDATEGTIDDVGYRSAHGEGYDGYAVNKEDYQCHRAG